MVRRILPFFLCLALLFELSSVSFGTEHAPQDFDRAVELLQKGGAAEALPLFQSLLLSSPQNPALLTNAGIAAAQTQQWGLAASYLRDAAHLAPSLQQTQQALQFVQSRLAVQEIPHNVELWESYREGFLSGLSLPFLLLIAAITTLLVGLLFLRWFNERRKADDDDGPLPPLKAIHVMALVLFLAVVTLCFSKLYEGQETRATILPEKVAAHSTADENAPSLFDLYAGLQVRVLRHQNDWVQVLYPGGPTGWVKQDALRISAISPF